MLSAVLAVALVAAFAPRLPLLRQRYDDAALAPIDRAAPKQDDPPLTGQLADWAYAGAGHGATLLPWSRPAVPQPVTLARVAAADEAAVRGFAYRLAGYHQLDERSRLGGILYRIGVQLRPLLWFAPRQADTPWDDAWLTAADTPRLTALARWLPRRPTLIVLADPQLASPVADALAHAARHGDQPVRVLVLDPAVAPGQVLAA